MSPGGFRLRISFHCLASESSSGLNRRAEIRLIGTLVTRGVSFTPAETCENRVAEPKLPSPLLPPAGNDFRSPTLLIGIWDPSVNSTTLLTFESGVACLSAAGQ